MKLGQLAAPDSSLLTVVDRFLHFVHVELDEEEDQLQVLLSVLDDAMNFPLSYRFTSCSIDFFSTKTDKNQGKSKTKHKYIM